ncbi:hypothetical protein PSELUDRAFT_1858 [Vogesella sp. LIG4]|nr:hypothetical protein PSELUDRAFT_1858 [Vogesella sp. LIG4]
MRTLTQRLDQAGASRDWPALAAADRELAALAGRLSSRALSSHESQQLPPLRAAHQLACQRCDSEMQQLTARMADWQQNREGWLAYALAANME